MVLRGALVTMLIECDPGSYAPYCCQEKGHPVLSSVGQDHLNTTNTLAKCFTN